MSADWSRTHADHNSGPASPIQRDRQRIVHSAAFRRLQFKTQVFRTGAEDHFRTRLTHTLEVAHLACLLARGVGADAELAEVVALAHDLGHPPFGHAGERALAVCLAEHGGFEHNLQTLRVIEFLEHPYPEFRGLNLTRVVRECLAKHRTRFDAPTGHPLDDGAPPPLAGQLVALADQIAYALHDLQDGLYAGLLDPAELREVGLVRDAVSQTTSNLGETAWRGVIRPILDQIQQQLIEDAVINTRKHLDRMLAAPDLRTEGELPRFFPAGFSAEMLTALDELQRFLLDHLYRNPALREADERGQALVMRLFDAYLLHPDLLPPRFATRIGQFDAPRVVADFIAGMTDRFCAAEATRILGQTAVPAD